MLPIDLMVEWMMGCAAKESIPNGRWFIGTDDPIRFVYGDTPEQLRENIRLVLQSLVPKPVLLSECEEGQEYLMVETPRRVCREFIYAVDVERQQRIARADQV